MSFSDEVLMAYADGELDARIRTEVEIAIAADPEVARRVAAHAALRQMLRKGFEGVLDEAVPDRLLAAARAAPDTQQHSRLLRFKGRTAPRFGLPQWTSLAASFVLGGLILHLGYVWYTSGPLSDHDGRILASGVLAQALSNQLAIDQTTSSPVRIGVSFRSKGGSYCRTFHLREKHVLAGLACRQDENWKLEMLAPGETSGGDQSEYRQASSSMPAAVAQAVGAVIDGEPLDAQAEADARTHLWRTPR